jgi:hypothetical protein
LFAAALVALVGLSLVGQSGGRPGSQAAVATPTATPTATSSPTAPPAPPPGTPPPRVAVAVGPVPTCPPGSTPDTPGPVAQARPPFSPWASAFDRRAGRVVLVAPITPDDGPGVATWTFDVCTNTWTRMHPNREPPTLWARLVYDVDSDVTLLVSSRSVWAYDLRANTWTEKGAATTASLQAYDPVSGFVVAGRPGPTTLVNYDVETDTWTPIHQANAPEEHGVIAYDASVDGVVAYNGYNAGHETWLLDIRTGNWSKSQVVAPHVLDWLTFPAIAYDEAAKRTVIGGNVRLAAYDATADRWETVEFPDPDAWHGVSIVYDPVNDRLVVLPDSWESWSDGTSAGVVAIDLVTREWTVLLEPGLGQSTPP